MRLEIHPTNQEDLWKETQLKRVSKTKYLNDALREKLDRDERLRDGKDRGDKYTLTVLGSDGSDVR